MLHNIKNTTYIVCPFYEMSTKDTITCICRRYGSCNGLIRSIKIKYINAVNKLLKLMKNREVSFDEINKDLNISPKYIKKILTNNIYDIKTTKKIIKYLKKKKIKTYKDKLKMVEEHNANNK